MFGELINTFVDDVIDERRRYFEANPGKRPKPADVEAIIRASMNSAGRWSFFFNLFWGPLGVIAIFPEIHTVLKRQFLMLYDLSVALGKEGQVPRELFLDIVLGGAKGLGLGMVVAQGGKLIVRRGGLRILQSLARVFAAKITQRVIKNYLVGKVLPFVGPFLMRFWARHTTRLIGRRASEKFTQSIEMIADDGFQQVGTLGTG